MNYNPSHKETGVIFVKKILTKVGKVIFAVFVFILIILAAVFVINKIIMKNETALLNKPIGQSVEVDGYNMNVYTVGEGEHTLLFLSGSGTACPVLDFRSLYSILDDDYKIVVIEKFGYGFSDVVDTERSFDTILRQDRAALKKAGISGPFIICPHSMSGLEAILWSQNYPDEVTAIVGLDMSLPRAYDNWDWNSTLRFEKLAAFARQSGLVRLYFLDGFLPEKLTREEKKIYRAVAVRIAVNECIINEGLAIPDAIKEIDSKPIPDIPMIMFVSNGKETGVNGWKNIQHEYASKLTDAKVIEFECGHYVHNFKQDIIADYIKDFVEALE